MQHYSPMNILFGAFMISLLMACGGGGGKSSTPSSTQPLTSSSSSTQITISSSSSSSSSKSPNIVAWVGEKDTVITPSAPLSGSEIYRTSQSDCDWLAINNCLNNALFTFKSEALIDNFTTLTNQGFYLFKQDNKQATLSISANPRITGQEPISFKGKMWLVGFEGDVWSSLDGASWSLENARAQFAVTSNRYDFVLFTLKNQLWLIGGRNPDEYSYSKDIWSTADGKTWKKQSSLPFNGRWKALTALHDNKFWLIGGYETAADGSSVQKQDVWATEDGTSWLRQAESADLPSHVDDKKLVSFKNQLWLVGLKSSGVGAGSFNTTDIWSSANGINWTQQPEKPFESYHFIAVVFNNTLWMIDFNSTWSTQDGNVWTKIELSGDKYFGTYDSVFVHSNQLWSFGSSTQVKKSTDAINWTPVQPKLSYSGYSNLDAVVLGDEIVLSGYDYKVSETAETLWISKDGELWEPQPKVGPAGAAAPMISFKNKLWKIDSQNKIWSSTDGAIWSAEATQAPFPNRFGANSVIFNNKIWMIGGYDTLNFKYLNDAWSSEDGTHWVQEAAASPFPGRHSATVTQFQGKLWLIGGNNGNSSQSASGMKKLNDIWSSEDGKNWVLVTDKAPFDARSGHQSFVFNNKLWVVGGTGRTPSNGPGNWPNTNNAWSTIDGINWTIELSELPFEGNKNVYTVNDNRPIVNFHNQLLLIGDGNPFLGDANGIWRSDDGLKWRKGFSVDIPLSGKP